jgi:hypothetical protein
VRLNTYRNEIYSTGKRTSKQFVVACGRSEVTPMMATKSATVDMAVKW